MVAKTYETVAAGSEILAVADDVCATLLGHKTTGFPRWGTGGCIKTLSVMGVKVRLIFRSDIDYSLGTDDWSIRFRKKPLPVGAVLRGDAEAFNRDMTVLKMIGAPYTLG